MTTTIALPASIMPVTCSLTKFVNQRVSGAPFGGSEQAIDLMNDRWLLSFDLPAYSNASGAAVEAFVGSMRGQTNVVALWHFARPQPRGTVRGTLTLNAAAAAAAASIVVTGCVPTTGTLLAGDMLSVATPTGGTLLLMVANDCTAVAGVITVPITERLRVACNSGAAVTWLRPTALFRLLNTPTIQYAPAIVQGVSLDFGEFIG